MLFRSNIANCLRSISAEPARHGVATAKIIVVDNASVDATAAQSVQLRLATIQREVERCKDIAQRFLTFARTKQRVVERTLAVKIVEDAAALIKAHPANQGCEIITNFPSDRLISCGLPGCEVFL